MKIIRGSVANYRKQESLDSQTIDFPIHEFRVLPRKGNFATEPQEEVRPTWHPLGAIRGEAPGWEHTMEMRVMVQLLAPGVEYGEAANLGPEMLRIPGNVLESRGHGVKEQPIE